MHLWASPACCFVCQTEESFPGRESVVAPGLLSASDWSDKVPRQTVHESAFPCLQCHTAPWEQEHTSYVRGQWFPPQAITTFNDPTDPSCYAIMETDRTQQDGWSPAVWGWKSMMSLVLCKKRNVPPGCSNPVKILGRVKLQLKQCLWIILITFRTPIKQIFFYFNLIINNTAFLFP